MRNRIFLWKVRGLAFATKSIFNALNNPRSSGAECLCSQSKEIVFPTKSSEFLISPNLDHGEGSSPSVLEENEWKTIAQSRVILGVSPFLLCQRSSCFRSDNYL